MNCLRLSVSRVTEPMSVSVERFTEPMSLSTVCLSRHLSVSVGLICAVGRVRLVSSDRFNLISKDGYILYSTLLN